MEKFSKPEQKNNKIEVLVNDILEKEKLITKQEAKTLLVAFSYYKETEPEKIEGYLKKFSAFRNYIYKELKTRGLSSKNEDDPEYKKESLSVENDLLDLYREKGLVDLLNKVLNVEEIPQDNEVRKSPTYAGLLNYDFHTNKKDGLNLEIHFAKNNKKENESNLTLSTSLSELCDKLVEEKKFPHKILAESWIMAHDGLRNQMGFEKIKEYDFHEREILNDSVWGQFIDNDGNLKKEEIEYLFKNNEPRHKITSTEITFEDLIRKFGKEYIGKELEFEDNDEFLKEKERIYTIQDKAGKYLKQNMDTKSYVDWFKIISRNPVWKTFKTTTSGVQFLNFLKKSEKEGLPIGEALSKYRSQVDEIKESFENTKEKYLNQFKKPNKFITINE